MEYLVVVVEPGSCQNIRNDLKCLGLLNKMYPCHHSDSGKILIPVTRDILNHQDITKLQDGNFCFEGTTFLVEQKQSTPRKDIKSSPAEKMRLSLRNMMLEKELWIEELEDEIPTNWEKYGDLVLFDFHNFKSKFWLQAGPALWKIICSVLRVNRIGIKNHIQPDSFRTPKVEMKWGSSSWVSHRDNGIRYSWDTQDSMFSAGNAPERHRIARLKCVGETVVDLYAGIGYFTLPFLIHAGARLLHACEWNPSAVTALKYNLSQNGVVEKCIVHEGDNREVCPVNVADRVNLGLLPSSSRGWKTACLALRKDTGGMLHIHDNVLEKQNINSKSKSSLGCRKVLPSSPNTCSKCKDIISSLPEESRNVDLVPGEFFTECERICTPYSFSFVGKNCTLKKQSQEWIRWKKLAWKQWALHVSHTICNILCDIHQAWWEVKIRNIYRVKSYAPHIDHLVLDLNCSPVEES